MNIRYILPVFFFSFTFSYDAFSVDENKMNTSEEDTQKAGSIPGTADPNSQGAHSIHHLDALSSLRISEDTIPHPLPDQKIHVVIPSLAGSNILQMSPSSFLLRTNDNAIGITPVGGGTTTLPLRFPHLLDFLLDLQPLESGNLLILGPGFDTYLQNHFSHISSPSINEILSLFPSATEVTVVDKESMVLYSPQAQYCEEERQVALSVLSIENGLNVSSFTNDQRNRLKHHIQHIPSIPVQTIKTLNVDFINHFPDPKSFDYIFALNSIFYPLITNMKEEKYKKDARKFIAKYLSALKPDGMMIVDLVTYIHMRRRFIEMPFLLQGQEKIWKYPKGNHRFSIKRIAFPGKGAIDPNTPIVYHTYPHDQTVRNLTTTDIFIITRLPMLQPHQVI